MNTSGGEFSYDSLTVFDIFGDEEEYMVVKGGDLESSLTVAEVEKR